MKKIIVDKFGEPDVLTVQEFKTPEPGPGQVRVVMKSIGMNHADLMARKGEYIISSGLPPFTPGIEGGGIIDAVGKGVVSRKVGDRVLLGADAPQRNGNPYDEFTYGGTYTTHYIVRSQLTVPAPDSIPDDQLGAIWLPYLTAYGCLVWKQKIKHGEFVAIPAASSSLGLAAAQVANKQGAIPIGLTTSQAKADAIKALPENEFKEIVVTHNEDRSMRTWHRDLRRIARRKGITMFFDPVAAGEYLNKEIHALGDHGTIWVYGLLGDPGPVDVTPLIRKKAAIRGWYLNELTEDTGDALWEGYEYIFNGFEKGFFRQKVAKTFTLEQAAQAHKELAEGKHVGKFVIVP